MFIGVDLGGTNIAIGIVNKEGNLLFEKSCPTGARRPYEEIIEDMISLIKEVIREFGIKKLKIEGIGIGIPGLVDKETGNVVECVNLSWENVPIKELIKKEFNVPVFLDNDAAVAALAEYEVGSMKGAKNSLLITIGTGIGGGIIIEHGLYSGSHGIGSEIGHMVIGENDYDCNCGRNGCFETFASATALIQYTKKLILETGKKTMILDELEGDLDKLNGKVIFDCAKKEDEIAKLAIERFIKYLGKGIVNLINVIDPEVIAIGGGISKAGSYLIDLIIEQVNDERIYKEVNPPKILLAQLSNEAGIIGAAMLCKYGAPF